MVDLMLASEKVKRCHNSCKTAEQKKSAWRLTSLYSNELKRQIADSRPRLKKDWLILLGVSVSLSAMIFSLIVVLV